LGGREKIHQNIIITGPRNASEREKEEKLKARKRSINQIQKKKREKKFLAMNKTKKFKEHLRPVHTRRREKNTHHSLVRGV
jgi:hypothetical protein